MDDEDCNVEHICETCGIREKARKIVQENGVEAGVEYRISFCMSCEQNPEMEKVKGIPFAEKILKSLFNKEVKDNWVPVMKEA